MPTGVDDQSVKMTAKTPDALCVVPCGLAKIWSREPWLGAVETRRVYVGPFASAAREYAERFYEFWITLSAKYGFLLPTDLVPGPYNVTFKKKRDPALISAESLRAQVTAKGLDRFASVVIVAGSDYTARVRAAFGDAVTYSTPLDGLPNMGTMISVLRAATRSGQKL